jgi:hypothetical protein
VLHFNDKIDKTFMETLSVRPSAPTRVIPAFYPISSHLTRGSQLANRMEIITAKLIASYSIIQTKP